MNILSLSSFSVLLAGLGITTLLCAAFLTRLMIYVGIQDTPNHRSSHQSTTPRSGGVAVLLTVITALSSLQVITELSEFTVPSMIGLACVFIALVGFFDDLWSLPWSIRLLSQLIAGIFVLQSGYSFKELPLPFLGAIELGWGGSILTLLWLVGFTNAFNFMDGINGIASGCAGIVCATLVSLSIVETPFYALINGLMVCAIGGFMIYNFPKGKIFLGDVGSQFIGFVIALMGVILTQESSQVISLYTVPCLCWPFIFDAAFTLIRRLWAGLPLEAHRDHLYQLLNRKGWSHAMVSCFYFFLFGVQVLLVVWLNASLDSSLYGLVFLPLTIVYLLGASLILK